MISTELYKLIKPLYAWMTHSPEMKDNDQLCEQFLVSLVQPADTPTLLGWLKLFHDAPTAYDPLEEVILEELRRRAWDTLTEQLNEIRAQQLERIPADRIPRGIIE